MKYKKKGQVDALQPLILALIVIGIVLTVGFLIFAETKTQVVGFITTTTVSNETFVYTNGTLVALTYSANAIVDTVSCTSVYNETAHTVLINPGNYTCNNAGLLVNDAAGDIWNETLSVTYTYKAPDYAYNASEDVQNATQDIPGWLPIIVVVVIGALLIGLVSFLRNQVN